MDRETVVQEAVSCRKGAPDWGLRRLLAGFGVSAVAVSLVLSAHMRTQAYEQAEAESLHAAQVDAVVAEFADWQRSMDQMETEVTQPDLAPGLSYAVAETTITSDVSDLVAYDFTELEIARISASERRCLADAIYYESRNESMMGKLGVADVVLNRVKSPYYPDSICGVVYQGSERRTGCQFSFTCDGSMDKRLNVRLYDDIDELAGVILAGMHMPVSRNATHYHADYVSPYWAPTLTPTATIGTHKFYRFPNKTTQTIVSAAQ